jgi:hypothetical protein
MRELWIENINSADAKELADEWELSFNCAGCEIYIWAVGHRMTIEWQTTMPDTVTHILSFIDDTFDDTVDLSGLNRALKNLKDDQAIVLDYNNGEFEIIEL